LTGYWMGVASRDHVMRGVEGGFCQFCHGKGWPLQRLTPGDRIIYYSPREQMGEGRVVQAFTAIGEVLEGEPYKFDMGGGFVPTRRDVRFFKASLASIHALLPKLSFTRDRPSWGYAFRRGFFPITEADYQAIARAMNTDER
jgi:EVE domain-containing protein